MSECPTRTSSSTRITKAKHSAKRLSLRRMAEVVCSQWRYGLQASSGTCIPHIVPFLNLTMLLSISPGDRQVIPNFAQALANGQTHFQIGDNTNIFDMTYIDNVVYAHIVAADRLWQCTKQKPSEWRLTRDAVFDTTIQYSDRTIGTHRMPTSEVKPLGPVRDRALTDAEKNAEQIFRSPDYQETRAITRTKFDPLSDSAMQMEKIVTDNIEKNSEVVNGHLEPPESP